MERRQIIKEKYIDNSPEMERKSKKKKSLTKNITINKN